MWYKRYKIQTQSSGGIVREGPSEKQKEKNRYSGNPGPGLDLGRGVDLARDDGYLRSGVCILRGWALSISKKKRIATREVQGEGGIAGPGDTYDYS